MTRMKHILLSVVVAILLVPSVASASPYLQGLLAAEGYSHLPFSPINRIIVALMQWLLGITGFVAIIAFVISGIMYMTAAGDDDQVSTAKKTAKYALYGLIVALGGLIVIDAIDSLLKGRNQF